MGQKNFIFDNIYFLNKKLHFKIRKKQINQRIKNFEETKFEHEKNYYF